MSAAISAAVNTAISLKPRELRALLAKTISAKESVLITGSPGIGKSMIVEQACVEAGADLIILHPVVSDPTDFKGLPAIVDGTAQFLPFGDLQRLIHADKLLVCFLDDLGQAPPAVQAAAMQLLLARRINGHKVSDHVVFIGATNRRQDRAGVSGILEPVKSRFLTVIELMTDVPDWRVWAASAQIRPEVIAWLATPDARLCEFIPTADMTNSPSPRGWHAVSRILNLNLPARLQLVAISGAVGEAQAIGFTAFLRIWQSMIDPNTVLASPDTAQIPTDPSAMYCLATMLADKVRVATMGNYCKYMARLLAADKGEFIAASVPLATSRDPSLKSTPAYISMMSATPIGNLFAGE